MGYELLPKNAVRRVADDRREMRRRASSSVVKRGIDIVASALALIVLSPLLALVAALIYVQDRGSPIFAQERIGLNGRKFKCLKFRSMVVDAQSKLDELLERDPQARAEWARDHKLRNDPRITGIGAFIRKTSIDELPQLINIIRGDMSIVGPRPIVEAEIERYGVCIENYCEVRPGLTGLWQVSGRNDTTYDERVGLDVRYVANWSVMGDLRIILLTIPSILFSRGAY